MALSHSQCGSNTGHPQREEPVSGCSKEPEEEPPVRPSEVQSRGGARGTGGSQPVPLLHAFGSLPRGQRWGSGLGAGGAAVLLTGLCGVSSWLGS